MKNALRYLLLFLSATVNAQNRAADPIENYYPDHSTLPVAVRVKLHIIQFSQNDPRNYELKDTVVLKKQIEIINSFYQYLDRPTLKANHEVDFIPDSKIRFVIKEIKFHVIEKYWDRLYYGPYRDKFFPLRVDSFNYKTRDFYLTGNQLFRFKKGAEVDLSEFGENSGKYIVDTSAYLSKKLIWVKLKGNFKPVSQPGKISYYAENNFNCSDDIWKELLNSDKNNLHIIYSGSSLKPMAFGCGPSSYFLNVSNFTKGGDWANAQLAAHELGHCLGLYHTDSPQFDDLPAKDKFGFIDCDSTEVSNNIMGYNKCRRYLSPKQIAHIHQLYSTHPDKIRTLIYSEYDPANSIIVTRNETWNRAVVVGGDLVIRKNKTLTIKKMISMPEKGNIILEDNAKLIVNGTTITNNCDGKWEGFIYCLQFRGDKLKLKQPKKKGSVVFENGGKTENLRVEN